MPPEAAIVGDPAYDFLAGAREALLGSASRREVIKILTLVGNHIGRRIGHPIHFPAWLGERGAWDDVPAGAEVFAALAASTLRRLGGPYLEAGQWYPLRGDHPLPEAASGAGTVTKLSRSGIRGVRASFKPLRKAVLPLASLTTGLLPATKAIPLEMLPVVDKPLIQYAIEEARASGIEQFCVVTGRGDAALTDHFDIAYELESILRERVDLDALKQLEGAQAMPGSMLGVRQQIPLGLGHALWCARSFIGDDPFAILLADDLMLSEPPCLLQLADVYRGTGGNVVAVVEVPQEQTYRYGTVRIGKDDGRLVEVSGLIEKPDPKDAPSNLSIVGRYVLMPEVIGYLAKMERGADNEVQLTDAMAKLIGIQPFHGLRYEGRRFDCSDKVGFLEAQVAFALQRGDLASAVQDIVRSYT